MIGLRVAHVLDDLGVSAAASSSINLMRWLKANGHATLMLAGDGARVESLREEGLDHLIVNIQRTSWWLGGRRKLIRSLREWSPDLLHVHQPACLASYLPVAEALEVPVVVSLLGKDVEIDPAELRHERIGMIVVPSEAIRAHLVGRVGCHRDQVAVLPYGIDFDRYPPVDPPDQVNTVGAIGHFDPAQGFGVLLEALVRLRDRGVDLRARLIGAGEGQAELQALVEKRGLGERVELLEGDARTGDQIRELDAFVWPSSRERLAVTVLKAMACCRPVVATAIASMPLWIHDGENGLLVPPEGADALAEALAGLQGDAARAAAMARAGRRYVEEHHDLQLIGAAAHEIYRGILRSGSDSQVGTETVAAYRRLSATE